MLTTLYTPSKRDAYRFNPTEAINLSWSSMMWTAITLMLSPWKIIETTQWSQPIRICGLKQRKIEKEKSTIHVLDNEASAASKLAMKTKCNLQLVPPDTFTELGRESNSNVQEPFYCHIGRSWTNFPNETLGSTCTPGSFDIEPATPIKCCDNNVSISACQWGVWLH